MVLLVVLVVVIVAAVFGYRALSSRYQEKQVRQEQTKESADANPSDNESVSFQDGVSATDETLPEDQITSDEIQRDKLDLAADFTMEDSDGETVRLTDHYGKPVIVNFWASWCPPCKGELPYFQQAYEEYGDQVDFMMVDLADGERETVELAKSYVDDYEYDFPLYFDTMGSGAAAYGIMSIPTTICITSDGYIYSMHIGAIDQMTLDRWVETLVEDSTEEN